MIAGYEFSGELERIAAASWYSGKRGVVLVLAEFAGYTGWTSITIVEPFLRKLAIDRITHEELKGKIGRRRRCNHRRLALPLDFQAQPKQSGALHMDRAFFFAERRSARSDSAGSRNRPVWRAHKK